MGWSGPARFANTSREEDSQGDTVAIYDDRISEDAILQFKSNNKIKGRRHALIDCGCGPNTSEPISPCQAMWGKELWYLSEQIIHWKG